MSDLMPKPTEPIAGPGGLITRSWRDYLRRFAAATSLAEVWVAIDEIRAQLADSGAGSFLPSTTQVLGRNSVQTTGTLADGVVLVQLQGDVQTPAASSYYGTSEAGARGFHPLPEPVPGFVPYLIAEGDTFTVPIYAQALFTMPIDCEGILVVDGYLVEVS